MSLQAVIWIQVFIQLGRTLGQGAGGAGAGGAAEEEGGTTGELPLPEGTDVVGGAGGETPEDGGETDVVAGGGGMH